MLELFTEEQQEQQLAVFPEPVVPNTAPINAAELAAQLTLVDESELEMPFTDRLSKRSQDLATHGARPLIEDVAMKEREEQLGGMVALAEMRARMGDAAGVEGAARLIEQAKLAMQVPPSSVEANQAVSKRALEAMAAKYLADRYRTAAALVDKLDEEGGYLGLRNLMYQRIAELQDVTGFGDKLAHFLTQLVPFADTILTDRALKEAVGVNGVEDFRTFWLGLNEEERRETMHQLLKTSDNPARTAELLRKIADQTRADEALDTSFNLLGILDVVAIAKGIGHVMRRGAPLVTLNETAGAEAAAKLAASDLLRGSKVGGLNDEELMARFLSIGKNPMDADPAAFAGMSSAGQAELRQAWDGLMDRAKNRLISSGLTPDEIKQGLEEIKSKYSVATNKAIHSVIFGEGNELGQEMKVYWQGPDGKAFGSKEAAEAWAKAEGKVNYQVVPKNTANEFAAKGWDEVEGFPEGQGNVLTEEPARKDFIFSQMRASSSGEPMESQLIDVWESAAQAGAKSVSSKRLLSIIAEQSADEDYRMFARHLLETEAKGVEWNKVGVELHYSLGGKGGTYNVADNRVRLPLNTAHDAEVILHELTHAHNAQVITLVSGSPKLAAKLLTKEQIAAAKEVVELHKRMKAWFDNAVAKERAKHGSLLNDLGEIANNGKLRWAIEHPAELIAYGLTSSRVRVALQKIKLSDLGYKGNDTTVFSVLWDLFKRVLGYRANDTALAKLVAAQDRLAAHIGAGAQKPITVLHRGGVLDAREVNEMMRAGAKMTFASRKGSMPINKAIDKEISNAEKQLAKTEDDAQRAELVERIKALRASKKNPAKGPAGTLSPTEEWLVVEQRTDPIAFSNIGKFSEEDIRSMPWIAVDPKHAASEFAVEERVIGVHAEAKTRRDLVKHLEPFFNKLNGAGKARVKAVLEDGDSYSNAGKVGKEFDYAELRARGLSDEEAQAYFAVRQVRMVSYHLRNAELVRTLRAEGYKEVTLAGREIPYAGRVLEEEQAGQASLGKVVYDTAKGEHVTMDSDKLAKAYAGGQRIVQFKQPVDVGKKHYTLMLVDETTARARDINTALHYRPGEFSRIYTDQYFITIKKMAEVDGALKEVTETVRTAASQREAAEYVEAHSKAVKLMQDVEAGRSVPRNLDDELEKLIGRYTPVDEFKKLFDQGELDGYVSMDWHYTRNKDEYLNSSVNEAVTNGRLFTSKRSGKLFSTDRDRVNTADVYESLEAEITNISRVANISMWRESMIRRWMNSFGHMIPNRTGNDVSDFYSAAGAKFTRGTQEALFAERSHKYILRQLGVRTGEEKFYENITRMLTEKLFVGNEPIESIGAAIRKKGWLGFLRNVNFNLNLGMFNPAQLIVQANGAATAAILSPVHGAKAAFTFPLLRMALMSDNPEVWRKLARVEKFKNLGLSDEGEFIELVRAIRRSGILDNIRSTALWNAEDGALDVFAGYPRRAAKSHTFFFNRGEEFSRVVSFDVARREWMAKNPGKSWNTDAALKQIVVRMDDLTQNMTKANLARFQEGALSIPFQFAQYNIKLAANVISAFMTKGTGRGFTKAEATQLLIGHTLLYGAAGNGLVWLADEFLGADIKESLSVRQKEFLAQGAIGWSFDMLAEALTGEGAKVALGSRLGSFDYYQRIGEAIFLDPKNVYEAILGPTVSSAKRLGVFGEVARLWARDPELTGTDILEGLSKMGMEQAATLRNAAKAYLYMQHQGKMLDRQGVEMGQLNKNELLMQALGFQPTLAVDINALIKSKQAHGEALDDIAKQILRVQRDIMTALNTGDTKRAEEQRKLLVALWPENAGDFREVQRRIRDRLWPHENEFQKLIGDYVRKGQTYDRPLVVTQQPTRKEGE